MFNEKLQDQVIRLEKENAELRANQELNTYTVKLEGWQETIKASGFTYGSGGGIVTFFDSRTIPYGMDIAYFTNPVSIIKQ